MKLHIGTSGYYYNHWQGVFYPIGIGKNQYFSYYQKYFDTVEINSTYYHLPRLETTRSWATRTSPEFLFAIKMWRRITHYKKLQEIEEDLNIFYERLKPLSAKIGCVLVQLPPSFKKNVKVVEEFIEKLRGYRHAIEFRNDSWACDEVYEILKRKNISFCLIDMPKLTLPLVVTADFVYIRFHGYGQLYGGDYPEHILKKWGDFIISQNKDAFVYFNNDFGGYAVKNALMLKELINEKLGN